MQNQHKTFLGQEQLSEHGKVNLTAHVAHPDYFQGRNNEVERESRATQIEPMGSKGVAYIDTKANKLVHIADYAAHLEGKQSVFDTPIGKYLGEQELSISVSCDDWVDEFFWNGKDERRRLSDPNGCCSLKRCTLKYDPLSQEGAVLAIAGNDNQPGTSASFGLKVESSAGWKIELSMENAKALGAKVFGITAIEHHDVEVGPLGRPADMSPPEGWTANDFDDS